MQIKEIQGHSQYFNLDFFFRDDIRIENLLIYGMGFQKAGYTTIMAQQLPRYKRPVIGGVIDEHILIRLRGLQNLDKLGAITFAYHTNEDMKRYKNLTECFDLKNIKFLPTSEFSFFI